MLRQRIEARGLMPAELEGRIAAALVQEEILVDPVVTVTIVEYLSRPISVAGAVRLPLTFQALGKTTLLEALTRAQGLTSDAGTEILVTHPPDRTGARPVVERVKVQGLIDSADPALNVMLEGGEEVRVPQVGRVFVAGSVKMPGAFKIVDGFGMTVLKALALAGGLMPFAAKEAYLYRVADGDAPHRVAVGDAPHRVAVGDDPHRVAVGDDPHRAAAGDDTASPLATTPRRRGRHPTPRRRWRRSTGPHRRRGAAAEVRVDLRKILDRKAPDVPLASNDIFYIPDNRKARITVEAIERTLGFAATTGSGILIYSHP